MSIGFPVEGFTNEKASSLTVLGERMYVVASPAVPRAFFWSLFRPTTAKMSPVVVDVELMGRSTSPSP